MKKMLLCVFVVSMIVGFTVSCVSKPSDIDAIIEQVEQADETGSVKTVN